jgi:fumarylacetoacetate (FAA) hydrolase
MRLTAYRSEGDSEAKIGVIDDDKVIQIGSDIRPFLGAGGLDRLAQALSSPGATSELADITYLPPLTPLTLRDFMAFEDHASAGAKRRGEELAQVWYERPVYYKGNPLTVIGHEAPIPRPAFTSELDLELEIACILGLPLLDATEDEAAEAIFGFTVMCDWSARDVQRVEMGARLGPAKSKDFATSLGPGIVTADEVGPHPALEMIARVNGETLVAANLNDAYWTFPKMLSFVSQGEQLHPGEVFGSGTPFGGCLLDQEAEKWLEPGDVVELEVSSIGVLRNAVYQG